MGKEWKLAENDVQGEWTLPAGWVWTTIGEITQPIEKVKPRDNPDEHFTYLDISSINNKSNRVVEPKAYYGAEAPSRARQLVRANDVLFSTVRTYLRNIALVPEAYDGQIASTGFSILRGEPGVSPKYLFYYALTDRFLSELGKLQRGTSYPAVRDGDVQAQPIPLAPLPEQRRIVAEIETQFTRLDAAVAALERAQANLRRYKAAVLKAACEGRLVPTEAELAHAEGRDYEPADQLLARILSNRRGRWEAENPGKKYKEPAPPDTKGLPELPEGWVWTNLGQVKSFSLYGPRFSSKDYSERGKLVLRTSDISESGKVSLETPPRLPLDAEQFAKYRCEIGDLLITRTGSLGTLAVFNDDVEAIPGAYLIQYRLAAPLVMSWYVFYLFKSPSGQKHLVRGGAGVGRPNLNAPTIEEFAIPLPPLAEQRRIVAEVERRLSLVRALEASVGAALARAGRLRQAVLKQAFEGRLVPQDPDDEPASMLLERIRAEREGKRERKQAHQMRLPGM